MVIETLNECIDKGMGLLRKTYWEIFSTGRQPTGSLKLTWPLSHSIIQLKRAKLEIRS